MPNNMGLILWAYEQTFFPSAQRIFPFLKSKFFSFLTQGDYNQGGKLL